MRKAKEVERAKSTGAYATPVCLVASLGYSPVKPSQLPPDVAVVLWLPESDAVVPQAGDATTLAERLASILPALQRVLMRADAGVSAPGAIIVVDCTPLAPAVGSLSSIVDAECCSIGGALGKQLG